LVLPETAENRTEEETPKRGRLEPQRLQAAWQQVRKNAGAAGIDQMTVEKFAQREEHLLVRIHDKLESGSYRFQSAKRVLIEKEGTSEARKLGIPGVMDRIVGTSMHNVLEEIFDLALYRIQLRFPSGQEPASGHTASTEAGERRQRMGGSGRPEFVF
jgi:retron-type reverse transcriptase